MVINSFSLPNQPTFSAQRKQNGGHSTRFGAATQQTAEQTRPSQSRSWFKTILLGAGVIAGLVVAGRYGLKQLGSTLFKQLGSTLFKQVSTTVGQEAGQAVGNPSMGLQFFASGLSLLSNAGPKLLEFLRSDRVLDGVIGGAKLLGAKYPAFKVVESHLTKENLRKLLNPDTFKDLVKIVKENQLNSFEGIKHYVSQNADQLSALLGDDVAAVLKQLFAAAA